MSEKMYFPYDEKSSFLESYRNVKDIYDHIVDEKSRDMFINRLMLSLTSDIKFIRKLVLQTDIGSRFDALLNEQRELYIYGAGIRGDRLVKMFPEKNWIAYIDRIKNGSMNNIPIVGIEKIPDILYGTIIITNYEGYDEIKSNLLEKGIPEERIIVLNDFETYSQKDQYFEERCSKNFRKLKGVFVDAGCFDGRDSLRYLDWLHEEDSEVYAFEPDEINWKKCKDAFEKRENIKLYKLGLSDHEGSLKFSLGKGEKSRLTEDGENLVKVNTIDVVLNPVKVAFIKMDVEGNEKAVLLGAKNKIKESHPNLMISIYHKREDILEIPKLLLELNSEYYFSMGHYAVGNASETVLYAFDK